MITPKLKTENFHPKPDWRKPDYRYFPAERIHSAMNAWAKTLEQPRFVLITKFVDGTSLTEFFDPATQEIGYKHDGEWYYQTVDVKGKWFNSDKQECTVKQLVDGELDFCIAKNIAVDSVHHFREGAEKLETT